jgi:uncharacterized membrane protein YesL
VDKWATFILVNILWAVLCIPLITLPAATAGLFAVMSRWVRGKPPELFAEFFGAMRRYWLISTLVMLCNTLIGGLLVVNLTIFPLMDMADPLAFLSRSITVFAATVLLLANLYIWPLMVVFDMSLRQLITMSLKLTFAHPAWSFGVLLVAFVPILAALILPAGVLVIGSMSCMAYIVNWGTWRIIRQYIGDEERQKLESRV